MVPVVVLAAAYAIAAVVAGGPGTLPFALFAGATSFLFIVPFVAPCLWLMGSRPGRSGALILLSALAAYMGVFLATSTAYDAGQIIILYPFAVIPVAGAGWVAGEVVGGLWWVLLWLARGGRRPGNELACA